MPNITTTMLEAVLRRDRSVLIAGLVAVLVLTWTWLLLGAGTGMTAHEMTLMVGMDGWIMEQAVWSPGYAAVMFSMWWVMMVAMMLPGAAPMLLLFARVTRKDRGGSGPVAPTAAFTVGYVVVWGGFSFIFVALQWAMETVRLMSPMLKITDVWLAAAILIATGLWQLTPIKTMCLRHCRTPLSFLMGNWRAGHWGALRMGLEHGAYCLGCCWFLMALLFFGGVMNLYWIVGLTTFVLMEKIVPLGHWFGRTAGMALVTWGILLPLL